MKPGQARLWTGICCVGTLVVLATALIVGDVPKTVLPNVAIAPFQEYLAILAFVSLAAIVLLPFDLIRGHRDSRSL